MNAHSTYTQLQTQRPPAWMGRSLTLHVHSN